MRRIKGAKPSYFCTDQSLNEGRVQGRHDFGQSSLFKTQEALRVGGSSEVFVDNIPSTEKNKSEPSSK